MAGALGLIGLTGLVVWSLARSGTEAPEVMRFVLDPPASARFEPSPAQLDVAISPDGTQILYGGPDADGQGSQINLRRLDEPGGAVLRGTLDGDAPFVSPDGEWIGYKTRGASTLMTVSRFGGLPSSSRTRQS